MAVDAGADDEAILAVYLDDSRPATDRERAFHLLVDRYQHRLFAVCVRVLGSRADAEEAVQETFVRLAREGHRFRGEAKLSTWLYRVARNVCTDRVRFEARRPSTPVEDPELVGAPRSTPDEIGLLDTSDELRRALAQLDDRSRTLLLLVAVEELTYAEVAAATGLAVGTVKSRVSRARVQLGELLRDDEQGTSPPAPTSNPTSPSHPDPSGPARGPPG